MLAFNPKNDIPDLSGKIVIVTGANIGIGFETAKVLLSKNATVYMACRSPEKAAAAISQLKEATGKAAIFLKLDLGDLHSVRKAAEEFQQKEERLDRLFNNAGVMVPALTDVTAQGYDMQWGTNVIGHFFFTKLLLPLLAKSKATTGEPARVIYVSSDGHRLAPGNKGVVYDTFTGGAARDQWISKSYSTKAPWTLYGQSKMGNVLLANRLARDFPESGIAAASIHPGLIVGTNLQQTTPRWQTWLMSWFSGSNEKGAYASLFAGFGAPAEEINGQYCVPWGKVGTQDARGKNIATQDEVVAWLEKELASY